MRVAASDDGRSYRHCTGAKDILSNLAWYVGDRLWRWMRKKYPKAHVRTRLRYRRPSRLRRTHRVWQTDGCEQFQMSLLTGERYKRGWMRHPDFTKFAGEPDA
jgi:RNA-directed DNA polymerase